MGGGLGYYSTPKGCCLLGYNCVVVLVGLCVGSVRLWCAECFILNAYIPIT